MTRSCFVSTFVSPVSLRTCSTEQRLPRRSKCKTLLSASPVSALIHTICNEPDPSFPVHARAREHHALCVFLNPSLVLTTNHSVVYARSIVVTLHSYSSPGTVVHACPIADLALVHLSNPFVKLDGFPSFLCAPPSNACRLRDPHGRQQFEFRVRLDQIRSFSPGTQTLPFLTSDQPVTLTRGWSGGVIRTTSDRICGVIRGGDSGNFIYAVPGDIIARFVGSYPGKPYCFGALPFRYQHLDESLAEYLELPSDCRGVRITGSKVPFVHVGDIITAVDGHGVSFEGRVELGGTDLLLEDLLQNHLSRINVDYLCDDSVQPQAVSLEYLCALKAAGSHVKLRVFRDGALRDVHGSLHSIQNGMEGPTGKSFFMFNGHVFSSLTVDYLREWGDSWETKCPQRLLAMARGILGVQENPVILTGYASRSSAEEQRRGQFLSNFRDLAVVAVNGHPVDSVETLQRYVGVRGEKRFVLEFDDGSILIV